MMIRILCLSIIVLLFCTDIEAARLKCYICNEKTCSKSIYCGSGKICMSSSIVELIDGRHEESYDRSCESPAACRFYGNGVHSYSVGSNAFMVTSKCCSSHLCNEIPPPHFKIPSGNGLACLFCNNTETPENCKVKECIGSQTHCITMNKSRRQQSGCSTLNFCLIFRNCKKAKPAPEPTTAEPTTAEPTTAEPTTAEPTTAEPTTAEPTTAEPTAAEPTAAEPTTAEPTTAEPTTAEPTAAEPTTAEPTAAEPTAAEPTSAEPTTAEPTTAEPTTAEPTAAEPTTAQPTTAEPTTAEPTTAEPTTAEPTTAEPTTPEPKCVPIETTPEPTLPHCGRKG